MIFVDRLGIVDAAEYAWDVVLRNSNESLDDEEDVNYQTDDVVGGAKVGTVVGKFVVLNNDKPANESQDADPVQDSMEVGTFLFLFRGVSGLK